MNAGCKYILLILFIPAVLPLEAQHNIIYRNHQIHQVITNPATAGSSFVPVAALSFRKQWLGVNQSPTTLLASASLRVGNFDFYDTRMMVNNSLIKSKDQIGLGLGIYADQNGPLASRGVNLAYAYHINFSGSTLAFGLAGNMEQTVLNGSFWDPVTGGDPLLVSTRDSYFNFNANAGVFFRKAQYFAGLAVNHLLPLENKLDPGENIKQDYILHGGYIFNHMRSLQFEPSLNLRYLDYETFEFDISAKLYLQYIHWISLTYRSYRALEFLAGMKIKQFYLAYEFEANLSSMIGYSAGSHGLHVGMNLGMQKFQGF